MQPIDFKSLRQIKTKDGGLSYKINGYDNFVIRKHPKFPTMIQVVEIKAGGSVKELVSTHSLERAVRDLDLIIKEKGGDAGILGDASAMLEKHAKNKKTVHKLPLPQVE